MKNDRYHRVALVIALLPLALAGCATQGETAGASAEAAKPVAVKPRATVAAAPQPVVATPPIAKAELPLPAPSALEVQLGIQIAHVGLTASGGLVDARFKVLDAAKARALLADPANTPMLITGDKPPLMAPHHALRGAKFGQGQVFYILYPNLRGAVQPGAEITVAMGPARLGPVTAQ